MTPEQLQQAIPYSGARAHTYAAPLTVAMVEFGINTPQRQAAFLAQLAVESGSLRYTVEIADGSAYDHRADLGNTKPAAIAAATKRATTPGRLYRGHGLIQLTGYDNHLACGQALGLDLVNQPELLTAPLQAARSAGWFWQKKLLNQYADRDAFVSLTRAINGGLNGGDERCAAWCAARKALGL